MKRIDKICKYVYENSAKLTLEDLKGKVGFSASDISQTLNILRNNVSKELNILLKQNKIIKVKGRPVLFLDRSIIEEIIGYQLELNCLEIDDLNDIVKDNNSCKDRKTNKSKDSKDPFDLLIGVNSGLKNQIEQAKAAMLYPPNGLHTLIVGQTGVGKTLFASMMHNYAKFSGVLDKEAPFIVFNCADYYNNPQLLISQIFGHIKGAFTGADEEKAGLVEKANNGILFLDEIHRLPPEGQEMIFYFMDTGTFNKLGETNRKRKTNVLLIGATTEEPGSALLKTFVRRIPIIINIPPLDERPVKDRLEIVKFLLCNEAYRVNKKILLEADSVKALIGSASYGNVGQMKSNIQLVCAKGFLNSIDNKDEIEIKFNTLPSEIKNGLFTLLSKRKDIEELSTYLDSKLVIMPGGYLNLIEEDRYEPPFNLYKIIEDKSNILKCEGVDDDFIKQYITTDIHIHIKSFYDKFIDNESSKKKILKIVDMDIVEFADKVKELVENRLKRKFSNRLLCALSLHISAFLNRVKNNKSLRYVDIEDVIKDNPNEFKVSIEIKNMIEEKYGIEVPEMEVIYLTLLISTINEEQNLQHVAVLVVTHGLSTASSMVDVTKKLLGEGIVEAIDMPLEASPNQVLEQIIEKVKAINTGKGVLFLVDMGSLVKLGSIVAEKTGIEVKSIDMVSTALVLEAVRKCNRYDMSLDCVYEYLKDFKGYTVIDRVKNNEKNKKAIITVCSTGDGTAEKLKQLVENVIAKVIDEAIEVIPIGVNDINSRLNIIEEKYNIIAVVGIMNPNIDATFISIEELIAGNGEDMLIKAVKNHEIIVGQSLTNNIVAKDLCIDTLKQFLTFLNPYKIISVLIKFVDILEDELKIKYQKAKYISLIIHIGCALERMVINNGLIYTENDKLLDNRKIEVLRKANEYIYKSLNIKLSDSEIFYIVEMI
ncbi:Transcriptional regulatory protein LevR, contains PRD, AAA+ and EIIA domains [Anaerovirgula multivorans]|uniref:Transcriptional regulatory protein LevR, contains PRD, AAA+ and EIIA domains n=1 Tax=Anaerovirgula multivorans TaxID=312168 RepID=A0A239CGJ2_9FIRM|nr:sigma-54-dependent transcriptional regulator [Anaerovirgula multivorans]SNS19220.1 Transcriptional regulatory protein LevR, contains PRD, AAA+ and EIIA domains [Anaerovirgula multivorans]